MTGIIEGIRKGKIVGIMKGIYTSVDPCIYMHGVKVESDVEVGLMVKLIGRKA